MKSNPLTQLLAQSYKRCSSTTSYFNMQQKCFMYTSHIVITQMLKWCKDWDLVKLIIDTALSKTFFFSIKDILNWNWHHFLKLRVCVGENANDCYCIMVWCHCRNSCSGASTLISIDSILSVEMSIQWKKSKWHLNIILKIIFTLQTPKRISESKDHALRSTTLQEKMAKLKLEGRGREARERGIWFLVNLFLEFIVIFYLHLFMVELKINTSQHSFN